MPIIDPIDNPSSETDDWLSGGARELDLERVRLLRDLPGGGEVYGGSGGAGPLSKELPSYLFYNNSKVEHMKKSLKIDGKNHHIRGNQQKLT